MKVSLKISSLIILLLVSAVFSQGPKPKKPPEPEPIEPIAPVAEPEPEPAPAAPPPAPQGIKLQIPTDSDGMPLPVVAPPKPDTVQKLGLASGLPLNLQALSAKDTAGFETYSKRYALIQDSISAAHRAIESIKKNTVSFMPKLEPKGEFEKQAEYDARKQKWDEELKKQIEKDTKSLTDRLAELEKAKAKVRDNQVSLYGTLEVKSNPSAVSIYIGKEEIGATPAEYNLLIPGTVKVFLRKEGYNPWDTTLQVAPGAKFKLNIVLEEKSIFSQENEIDFGKLLAKDTDVKGYEARIGVVYARKAEVDEEIKQIMGNFSNTYPALEPKRDGESEESFNNRHKVWTNEGMRQFTGLQKKHEAYSEKLRRSFETLNDYIISTQSQIISEVPANLKIELGGYDAESESFELVAQDSASEKSPFYFSGKVGVPVATAKGLNKAAPGFATVLQFINYPFATDSLSVNLAMYKLQLSMGGSELKVAGSFTEIERYKAIEGYNAWKLRADSLLSGALKPKSLDYAYAMGKAAAKEVEKSKDSENGGGLGWRGWTRITTYTLVAGCGVAAVVKGKKANRYEKDIDNLKKSPPSDKDRYENWRDIYKANADIVNKNRTHRNVYGGAAGVLFLAGTTTFFF